MLIFLRNRALGNRRAQFANCSERNKELNSSGHKLHIGNQCDELEQVADRTAGNIVIGNSDSAQTE